jgi:hypothetical protein
LDGLGVASPLLKPAGLPAFSFFARLFLYMKIEMTKKISKYALKRHTHLPLPCSIVRALWRVIPMAKITAV